MAGELYIAESSGKDVVGVALWFGPGREMFDRYHTFIPQTVLGLFLMYYQ